MSIEITQASTANSSDINNDHGNSNLLGNTMLSAVDVISVVIYFLLVMATGIYSMCRPNRGTVEGYFLAGRYMWWLPVGASLFASNIGSEHFIGLAGSGAAAGIGVGSFEFNAMALLQLLGWVFLPVFIASGVNTLPEYTKKRFGGRRIQTYLAVLSLILYIFTKISVNMYSGAIFLQQALRVNNLYLSISILLLMTCLCTVFGGLAAVIYTDTLQFFIMIGGSLYVTITSFQEVGGYAALQTKYLEAIPSTLIPNTTCGVPRVDSWKMLRSADPSESDMPWPAFLMGQTPASIWYWCADQIMVQRAMAARSLSHAKGGTIMAGFAKILPLFIIVLPGMISRVLFPDEVGCVDPEICYKFCRSRVSCTNSAYPKLVLEYLPNGMRGIMISVMFSALMSDLTSIFNSASTLFTIDIWSQFRPKAKGNEKILVGRCFILILVVTSILWIPVIERTQGGQLYIYIQSIAAYLTPPIAATYCLAIIWKRMNEFGAFWGLIAGFVVGVVRMIIDFYYGDSPCHIEDERPLFLQRFHYMYFATFLFWVTVAVVIVVSLMTPQAEDWRVIRTTFLTRLDHRERKDDVKLVDRVQNTHLLGSQTEEENFEEPRPLIPWYRKFYNWLLGYDNSAQGRRNFDAMNKHIAELSNLHEEKWEKILLNSMLTAILLLMTSLYIYFSINPFSNEEVHNIQRTKLHEMGYDNIL